MTRHAEDINSAPHSIFVDLSRNAASPNLLWACLKQAPYPDEARMLALLEFVPSARHLVTVVDVQFVRLVVARGMKKLFAALRAWGERDVGCALTFCASVPKEKVRRKLHLARATINTLFELEVIDAQALQAVSLNLLTSVIVSSGDKASCSNNVTAFIALLLDLFEVSILHAHSAFGKALEAVLVQHLPPTRRAFVLAFLHAAYERLRCFLENHYKHALLSTPESGSRWLSSLCFGEPLEFREARSQFSIGGAVLSRLGYFARLSSLTTKRDILCARVDGKTLFDVAIACKPAHPELLEALVHVVTVEHPRLLAPDVYKHVFAGIRDSGYLGIYQQGFKCLENRVTEAFADASCVADTMEELTRIVQSGFPQHVVTLSVCEHAPLRARNVLLWRALLKECLRVFHINREDALAVLFS